MGLGSQSLTLVPELLEKRPGLRNYDGKMIVLGIRPEDFEDAALAPDTPPERRLSSTVELIEALGSEIMVHFDLDARTVDSGDPDVAAEDTTEEASKAVARFNPRSRVRLGETIEIAVATENLHFFDLETRQAIWD